MRKSINSPSAAESHDLPSKSGANVGNIIRAIGLSASLLLATAGCKPKPVPQKQKPDHEPAEITIKSEKGDKVIVLKEDDMQTLVDDLKTRQPKLIVERLISILATAALTLAATGLYHLYIRRRHGMIVNISIYHIPIGQEYATQCTVVSDTFASTPISTFVQDKKLGSKIAKTAYDQGEGLLTFPDKYDDEIAYAVRLQVRSVLNPHGIVLNAVNSVPTILENFAMNVGMVKIGKIRRRRTLFVHIITCSDLQQLRQRMIEKRDIHPHKSDLLHNEKIEQVKSMAYTFDGTETAGTQIIPFYYVVPRSVQTPLSTPQPQADPLPEVYVMNFADFNKLPFDTAA